MWWVGTLIIAAATGEWQAFGVVTAAGVTGTIAYLVARRANSGGVHTSDAATLFEESREIRRELRAEVSLLRGENASLRERTAVLEAENRDLRGRVNTLEQELHGLRGTP